MVCKQRVSSTETMGASLPPTLLSRKAVSPCRSIQNRVELGTVGLSGASALLKFHERKCRQGEC